MLRPRSASLLLTSILVVGGCGDDESSSTSSGSGGATSSTADASSSAEASTSASTSSTSSSGDATSSGAGGASSSSSGTGGAGGGASCLDEHEAGERFPVGDDCNFCDCNADGTSTCTARTCTSSVGGCTYDGVDHAYGERFPDVDDCNECVCAASGLACTVRDGCDVVPDSAILVESLDTPCGEDDAFTAAAVLDGLPLSDFVAPFAYDTDGPLYPETLPDTDVRVRIVYDGGFAVCRIPNPGQEAFDIEVLVEWITADGAFDEGFHTYLRRNAGGFVDGWFLAMGTPADGLDGSYDPACFDDNGFGFGATLYADATADGFVDKLCETDLLLTVGSFTYAE